MEERHEWPAFSLHGASVPLKAATVRAWHKEATVHVLGEERAKLREEFYVKYAEASCKTDEIEGPGREVMGQYTAANSRVDLLHLW